MRRVHLNICAALALGTFSAAPPAFADPPADAPAPPVASTGRAASAAPVASAAPAAPAESSVAASARKPSAQEVVPGVPLPPDVALPPIENSWRAILGARVDLTHASTGHTAGGAMVSVGFDGFGSFGSGITRIALAGGLGGGGAGFEGDLALALFAGKRWDVVDHGGPFFRLGGEGHLGGNDLLYDSRLIVPELEAGFEVLRSPNVVDVALYAGPMLDGRAGIGDDSRRLAESLAYGTRAALHQGAAFVSADASLDTPSHGFGDPSLSLVGRACYAIFPTSFCLDARILHADEGNPSGAHLSAPETAERFGASFGLGL